jgi:D-alanyl-D-alanine carboxypeptidase (penicillin-binding protein 5/6)
LHELFLGLSIPSGNDAAIAVARVFAPSVADFASLMNDEMKVQGLPNTVFVEPSGISENNITNAYEFTLFCRSYVLDYPENLPLYHTVKEFSWPKAENVPLYQRANPGTITQANHVRTIFDYDGCDGLKTGYIDESGYNIALTAERNGTRFAAVILGVPAEYGGIWGPRRRDDDSRKILDYAFDNYHTVHLDVPGENDYPALQVWKAKEDLIALRPKEMPAPFTAPLERANGYSWEILTSGETLIHPIAAGTVLGTLAARDSEGILFSTPLCSVADTEKAGFWKRLVHSWKLFWKKHGASN